jgi:dephospho-CoA kinase
MNEVQTMKEFLHEVKVMKKEGEKIVKEASEAEREKLRAELMAIAEELRKTYNWPIPKIRHYLHEMIDLSI